MLFAQSGALQIRGIVFSFIILFQGAVEGPGVAVRDGDSAELADQGRIPLQMDKPAAVCTGREIVAFAAGFPVNEDTLACADISGMLFT